MNTALPKKNISSMAKNWMQLTSLGVLLIIGCAGIAHSEPKPTSSNQIQSAPTSRHADSIALKQLGAQAPLSLRGVDGRDGVSFNVRTNEVITKAELKLFFTYSPAMLTDLSHLNVLVNGEVAASLPFPKEKTNTQIERVVNIPPRLLTEFNNITFQLIGHYTLQCEDPLHSTLWANISNKSVLNISYESIALQNNLALLPIPFMDRRDSRQLNIPFIFASNPDNVTMEASGTLASWFGSLAGYRGALFPAKINEIPLSGNAVAFLIGDQQLAGIPRQAIAGPTASIITNPKDPNGKLLLIMGRDAKELKLASAAVALGNQALTGETALITQFKDIPLRKPYDAPNWLPSNRKVTFSELNNIESLNVSGYSPEAIRVNFRLPPDLFSWGSTGNGIPIDLKYRYTPQPATTINSILIIKMNGVLVKSEPLLPEDHIGNMALLLSKVLPDKTMPMDVKFHAPIYSMRPRSQLQMNFVYDYIKEGECRDIIIDNVRGSIEPGSTIDISEFPHYLAMPNLSAFKSSGFPFTRLADLSQTAVILPDNPNTNEYSTYLAIMGRLGESTGYPATAVSVISAAQVQSAVDKDLLIIASDKDQPLLKQWESLIPAFIDGKQKRFDLTDFVSRIWKRLTFHPEVARTTDIASFGFDSSGQAAIFAGFESPLKSGRSAVLVWGSQSDALITAANALLSNDESRENRIDGSLTIVRENESSVLENNETYYVGSLPWFTYLMWTMSRHLILLLSLGIVSVGLIASLAYLALKALARKRLQ